MRRSNLLRPMATNGKRLKYISWDGGMVSPGCLLLQLWAASKATTWAEDSSEGLYSLH